MNERDQDRLEEIYEKARALGTEARASFLAEVCAGDSELERELTSLLELGEPAEAFFVTLADVVVSPSVGHQVGHYRLVGMLGTGGMGTVYRAHDERLDRMVALKFLPPYLSAQPEACERFRGEARAAAALDHPNVCSIHEIGETADGRPFIAMACYDGETLKERLSRAPQQPPHEAIRIALALAHGLGAAHDRGIVHRDVKPGNVMLCADGTVRLLDFGLAKVADLSMTGPGVTQGTIAYMSPEQARGDPVDPRADLWSLGVVLYEMLAGTRPFRGGNDRAVIEAIFHATPDPLPKLGETQAFVPPIVSRLLEKAPEDRYRSAHELVRDLAHGAPPRTATKIVAGLVGVTALLALGLLLDRTKSPPVPVDSAASTLTIAVLPFTVRGPGLDVWREGMVDLLSIGLDGAAGIRAINSRTLLAKWHQEIGDTTTADLESALGVARRSNARYALVGAVVAAGPRLRLSADIYEVATGRVVGPVQVEGPADSVLTLVDRVGMQTLGVILEKNAGEVPQLDLAGFTTNSLFAMKAYLEGEDHYRRSEFPAAITAWERAVRADTLFALAELGLADAWAWRGNGARFLESLTRAKKLEDRLPDRERAMMEIRWERRTVVGDVLPTIREALRKFPDAADVWYQLGEVYYHDAVAMGRSEDAEAAFRKAVALQPTMAPYGEHLLELSFRMHVDSAFLVREVASYARMAPQAAATRAGGVVLSLAFGDTAARARANAELGALDSEAAASVYHFLGNPFFAKLRDGVYRAIEPRLKGEDRAAVQEDRFRSLGLTDGRLREALAVLGEPGTQSNMLYAGTVFLSERDLPVPESDLRRVVAAVRSDTSLSVSAFAAVSAASAAARLADWASYNDILSRMRGVAERARRADDPPRGGYWDWAVRVVEAHGLWRHGQKAEALRQLESTLAGDPRWYTLWDVAKLSLELGKFDQAEHAFRALLQHDMTPAYLELARILERRGRAAEARDAYRFVVNAWRQADPELRPLVDEARHALVQLPEARD